VPTNSVYVTLIFTSLIALIIIGSPPAFNIILSVSATGLFTSYIVVISVVLIRKLRGETFPPSRFNVGRRLGIFANIAALCFLSVAFVFLFFPQIPSPDAPNMNWAILIYGVVVSFALIYYYIYGRHHYDGPVQ
jgi:amino acid transporter